MLFGGKNATELLKFHLFICLFVFNLIYYYKLYEQQVQFVTLAI